MPNFDIYSKRQKRSRGEMPDVFQYEDLPQSFRVQVAHILRDALGVQRSYDATVKDAFKFIHDTLAREYGMFVLNDYARNEDFDTSVYEFLLKVSDIERALDVIELAFKIVNTAARDYNYSPRADLQMEPDAAIEELNARFLEHDRPPKVQ